MHITIRANFYNIFVQYLVTLLSVYCTLNKQCCNSCVFAIPLLAFRGLVEIYKISKLQNLTHVDSKHFTKIVPYSRHCILLYNSSLYA